MNQRSSGWLVLGGAQLRALPASKAPRVCRGEESIPTAHAEEFAIPILSVMIGTCLNARLAEFPRRLLRRDSGSNLSIGRYPVTALKQKPAGDWNIQGHHAGSNLAHRVNLSAS